MEKSRSRHGNMEAWKRTAAKGERKEKKKEKVNISKPKIVDRCQRATGAERLLNVATIPV